MKKAIQVEGDGRTAKQKYDEYMADDKDPDAIERLRFFCAQAMNGQDWLDVEPFFNDVIAATTTAHGVPVIRLDIANQGEGDYITGWSNLQNLKPGVYELFAAIALYQEKE